MSRATAPGKIILLGEHAVVYGQPALAAPVTQLFAEASVEAGSTKGIVIHADDLGRHFMASSDRDHPLSRATFSALELAGQPARQDLDIIVRSTLPIASGLGSGAAISTAIIRAVLLYFGVEPDPGAVSERVFEVEKLFHGTPSGIDNTVISYGMPVYFVRGAAPVPFKPGRPIRLLIADTGVASPTRITVGRVREGYEREPERFQQLFEQVGAIVEAARHAIELGEIALLGRLMNENQGVLREMTVSSPELERLIEAAMLAGALGAKLSGGGGGGNMIALAEEGQFEAIRAALQGAGAVKVIETVIE